MMPPRFSVAAGDRRQESDAVDAVAPFRPVILGIRGGTTVLSVLLSAPAFLNSDWSGIAWCGVIVAYNLWRIVRPVRFYDDIASLMRVIAEVALHVVAVIGTNYWDSPLVFPLLTAIMVAGFARGFGFALRIGAASALAISIPDVLRPDFVSGDLRISLQWTGELLLVALIAGYAKRITGETGRQHSLALDRLGRLADANSLLFSLHRVAQTLPASLDLDEVLDSTMMRLRDLFRYEVGALLLLDEADGGWSIARSDGPRLPNRIDEYDLPAPLRSAIRDRVLVNEADLASGNGPGLTATSRSGLYAILPARDSIVGIIVLEHPAENHFVDRDAELLAGFAEPVGLALDNARWFARLRTVGADEERTRIARDLHDRIGQSLAYLGFELDRMIKTDKRNEPVTDMLEQLRADVRGIVGEVRDTLYDLRTDVSDANDVPTTLRSFLKRVGERSMLNVDFDDHVTGRLPLLQEREFWRIAQEAVANVERHADATLLQVRWWCDGHSAVLQVNDNGRGFAPGRSGRIDSYGVTGMRERAASIGATLDIDTKPQEGTTVRCLLLTEEPK